VNFVSLHVLGFEYRPKLRTERSLYAGLILSIAANRLWGNGLSATREVQLQTKRGVTDTLYSP
jgi:hypothetical protein